MNNVLIIAEAGVNHNGDFELAKQMAVVAKKSGADIVKYQTAIPELVMSKTAAKADYQKVTTGADESQLDMAKKIHLPLSAYKELKQYCEEVVGIKFISTPFDHPSIDILNEIGMDIFKIPSGEITNKPYLEKIGALNKKVILSTGMSNMEEVVRAFNTLVKAGTSREKISVLHCTSDYPAKFEDLNLAAMISIKNELNCEVGYSDHSVGLEASIAAIGMGATIIEKHFTLDKNMEGPDHKASLNPEELTILVKQIRNIEMAIGDGVKRAIGNEINTRSIARRSIHAAIRLRPGDKITMETVIMKRPNDGISPFDLDEIIGKTAITDILEDTLINFEDLD